MVSCNLSTHISFDPFLAKYFVFSFQIISKWRWASTTMSSPQAGVVDFLKRARTIVWLRGRIAFGRMWVLGWDRMAAGAYRPISTLTSLASYMWRPTLLMLPWPLSIGRQVVMIFGFWCVQQL